jgi:hypothetical protein
MKEKQVMVNIQLCPAFFYGTITNKKAAFYSNWVYAQNATI